MPQGRLHPGARGDPRNSNSLGEQILSFVCEVPRDARVFFGRGKKAKVKIVGCLRSYRREFPIKKNSGGHRDWLLYTNPLLKNPAAAIFFGGRRMSQVKSVFLQVVVAHLPGNAL